MKMNNYDKIAEKYVETDSKPDKQFSILPTVLSLTGDLSQKTVLDIGCGSGFFTRALARLAKRVVGIDNSEEQIRLAKENQILNEKYIISDFRKNELPSSDVIVAPFVFGYCKDIAELKGFFAKIHKSLSANGKMIGVIDLPSNLDLKRFGAVKRLSSNTDGSEMEIALTNGENDICILRAYYFTPETIDRVLREVGFQDIKWHDPIISQEGLDALPQGFWDGYTDNSELGYFTATKSPN